MKSFKFAGIKYKHLLLPAILIISCLISFHSHADSEEAIRKLYGNYLKGLFHAEEGNFKQALKEFDYVKRADPNSIYVRLKIASILIRMGELSKAEVELKEAKTIDPEGFDASLGLIFLYSYSQKEKELEEEYEEFLQKAHKLKPQDTQISEYLAQFYFYKKQPQDALRIYEDIIKAKPDNVDALFWVGYIYEETNRRDEAIKIWKRVLQLAPNHGITLNSLGYLYAEEGKNLDEAEEMIKKALQQEPDNGAYLDSLGWVYFKKKEYKKAEECLKKAVIFQEDPVIYEHIGDLYIVLGDKIKAIEFYKKGLNRFPANQPLKTKIEQYGNENKTPKK